MSTALPLAHPHVHPHMHRIAARSRPQRVSRPHVDHTARSRPHVLLWQTPSTLSWRTMVGALQGLTQRGLHWVANALSRRVLMGMHITVQGLEVCV